MHWRVIPFTLGEPAWNMALDEAILESFIAGQAPATLRFYGWSQPAVTIGRLQAIASVPEGWGRPIIRRPTGGRAVLHGGDLTFSFVVSAAVLGSRVLESYRRLGQVVARALVALGVPAELCEKTADPSSIRKTGNCFDLTLEYELAVRGRKVLGSAQVRRSGAVLQQNSLARPPVGPWPAREELVKAICAAVEAEFDVKLSCGEPSPAELRVARELADNKYASDSWNALR